MENSNHIIIDSKELDGKRVLVTGGTKGGMGEAIVKRLTKAGATVITTARTTPDELKESDLFIQADISTPDGTAKIVAYILKRFGGVDILVNNVGALLPRPAVFLSKRIRTGSGRLTPIYLLRSVWIAGCRHQ